ncbi:MAG: tetratricopeptide repeat protein [Gammaproteobacteria bacterium]|nr:tetratricopeptide repeat protein [Gammaproteobacteria bacterium]
MSTTTRLLTILLWGLVSACQTLPPPPVATNTLSEIDIAKDSSPKESVFIKPKTKEEIRKAYAEYLNNAVVDEKTRLDALTRLAELEYRDSDKYIREKDSEAVTEAQIQEKKLYYERLQRTIDLLSTSVRDYPDAKGNDTLLYQLAKAQAQNDQHDDSIASLDLLAKKYPKSPYYAEAQFRIAEDAFSLQDYSAAEYAYGEVLISQQNDIFYEKSLFKRGWSRFKQQFYSDAVEDYIEAVLNHEFGVYEKLDTADKEQFDEYFRAIALSFTYQNDTGKLANYFKGRSDFIYTYHTYQMIGDLYLKQERYSDAVDTHRQFIKHFPNSGNLPYAYLKIIEIWKDSGFNQQIYQAIDDYYVTFNPDSKYWVNQNENSRVNRVIRRSLREYMVLMTGYFHNRFQSSSKDSDYQQADRWYQRYLKYYDAYAQQDKAFFLYGELLAQKKQNKRALNFYELAAFDNEQILHKEASYAAIVLTSELYTSKGEDSYLQKNITYAKRFSQQYPQDKRTTQIALHAAEQAHNTKRYRDAIELADLALVNKTGKSALLAEQIKATAYFNLEEYEEAESLYSKLLALKSTTQKLRNEFYNNLALSIYQQAVAANDNKDTGRAVQHFARISTIVPKSEIAATGLYDAIALNMQYKQWDTAIAQIDRFQHLYPKHKYSNDVSKKLSAAYLSSNQGIKAAAQFEKIARTDSDLAVKAAAQWQAAEIYAEKNKLSAAIKAYQDYATTFKKPYSQRLEAMDRLAGLYARNKAFKSSRQWYKKIVSVDEKALNNARTDISRQIASNGYLVLARHQKSLFDNLQLTLPLKNSLRKKKSTMQNSVKLYGKASLNKVYEITSEATYSIGKIYEDFSQALLKSDRPKNLNEDELDQYEILLEDQAFPFEDKSIEFFEINLARVKDGLYNDWIKKSLAQLANLFPVRYNRRPKLDDFVIEMQ